MEISLRAVFISFCVIVAQVEGSNAGKEDYGGSGLSFRDDDNPEYGDYWEGDIELDERDPFGFLNQSSPLNAIWDKRKKWPGNVLFYEVREDYSRDQLEKLYSAMDDLVESVKVGDEYCVRMIPRSVQRDYVYIVDGGGCSSAVGRRGGGQRLNLAPGCLNRHGSIMHEFLHAFGFQHEHKRADRDEYVTINWDNIKPGKEGNFRLLVENVTVDHLGTPYDYSSIMHYGAYTFTIDRHMPTIIPTDPTATIGQRKELTHIDVERVQLLYNCISPESSIYFKHLSGKMF